MDNYVAKAFNEIAEADRVILSLENENRKLMQMYDENRRKIVLQIQRKHLIEDSIGMHLTNEAQPVSGSVQSPVVPVPQVQPQPYTVVNTVPQAVPVQNYPVNNTAIQPQPVQNTYRSPENPYINKKDFKSLVNKAIIESKTELVKNVLSVHGFSNVEEITPDKIAVVYRDLSAALK